jgi:DNA-directed RNA polymerase specialized sigma24 family protein
MQPRTETTPPARGDEAELYRRHHRDLHRAVARAVNARCELIEDACQTAWAILLRTQPERHAIFAWLRIVAIHEAYRLSAIERRETRIARCRAENRDGEEFIADPHTLDDALEALEALQALAALPARQRVDLTLKVAGYTYEEIRILTGGRTFTNVNKSLVKARRRIRRSRSQVA